MKNLKRKSIVLLIAVAALLTLAIGGTVAYLIDVTPNVVNTFEPGKVETEEEMFMLGCLKKANQLLGQA